MNKGVIRTMRWMGFAVLWAVAMTGCASHKSKDVRLVSQEDGRFVVVEQGEYEDRLRNEVESDIRRLHRREGPENARIFFNKPYYYQAYAVYPSDEDVYTLEFTEKESRTTPITADMEVEKIRFATEFHRKRDEARADDRFHRSRGVEQFSYELRNGLWRHTSTLFVAQTFEEQVDGEWRPIEKRPKPVFDEPEEKKGLLGRLLFWR